MEPTQTGGELTSELAGAIVALGHGRVRQVVMIGSRADGRARPDSDLDLVVDIELPPGAKPWGGEEFARSRLELQSALGPRPVCIDIRVRTTDRFAEARDVPGGAEWEAAHRGVVLFEAPLGRSPTARTTAANVRRELVSSWMHHAISALEALDEPLEAQPPQARARRVIERLIAAVLTHRGLAPQFDRDLRRYVCQVLGSTIRQPLERPIRRAPVAPRAAAIEAAAAVLSYLREDAQQERFLLKVRQRLSKVREV